MSRDASSGEAEEPRPLRHWRRYAAAFGLVLLVGIVGVLLELAHPAFALAAVASAAIGFLLCGLGRAAPAPPPVPAPLPPRARVEGAVGALVSALPEPALLLTPAGDILIANERVAISVGPAKVGDPLSFLVRVPEVLEAVRAGARDGLPRRVEFGERIPLDRWLEAHIVPLRLLEKEHGLSLEVSPPDTVLLTFRDLTQQRRVEQMRADFVANASHELRTPLASLSGFIETLQGPARNDPAARDRFLGIMVAQARRMSRLIDDLLSLSRIELNAHVRPETQVELGMIVAHVCETLSPLARERGVELSVQRPEPAVLVLGERDELIRLVENLVENALKYGASGKRVEVTVGLEGGEDVQAAFVSVRDFGPGIALEHLPRLTERFYRVDIAASRDQGGTGLGLAIVKHIVARHRGRLSIDSQPDAGATFTVRLDCVVRPVKAIA
ncbi:ATP-binding protein [Aquabacter sp. CN5-332]|uniref:ATP-binding protein n=1 Tax=Aquabacter sp. CN5-332 TaxID=3156608 RepID=UPI0032B46673